MMDTSQMRKVMITTLLLLIIYPLYTNSLCVRDPKKSIEQVIHCIKHHYDNVQRPNGTDGKALNITVDIVVISIGSLNDIEMDYTLEFYLRQRWLDPLLQYNQHTLTENSSYAILQHELISRLWNPDTYIENVKAIAFSYASGPLVNQGLRLFPNGTVLVSSRLSARLSCKMDFKSFPMDKQNCPLTLSSYFFTEKDLYYSLGEVSIYEDTKHNNQFDILGFTKKRTSLKFTSGIYSSMTVIFKFRRRIQNFMLGFYIPSILTVMLSWVSFFISPNSAPARCALGIVTVLAVGGFLTGQRNSFPVVSYVMAADLYILVCYIFTFLALVEYAAVHYFFVYELQLHPNNSNKKQRTSERKAGVVIDDGELEQTDESADSSFNDVKLPESKRIVNVQPFTNTVLPSSEPKKPRKRDTFFKNLKMVFISPCILYHVVKSDALIIDKFARIAFPLTFAFFNVCYWIVYKAEHNSDS